MPAPGYRSVGCVSPIAARQRAALPTAVTLGRFGLLGAATSSVYSGPPVGEGAGAGAATGAAQGAGAGAVAGPIGMAIGAVAGAIGGAIAGAIGKKDPEQYSFDAANAIYKQSPQAVLAILNKYLPLAGLFDLQIKTNIPIWKKYGRMGEQRFLSDMSMLIYNAAAQGIITARDTPATIMTRVVQPWIDSWGFGPMADPNAGFINMLLLGLIVDYVTGAQTNWLARGGDYPFGNLPAFSLSATPQAPSVSSTGSASMPSTAPATVYTVDTSTVTSPGSAIRDNQGNVIWLAAPAGSGGYQVYVNGTANGQLVRIWLGNRGIAYGTNAPGTSYQLTGGVWNALGQPTAPAPVNSSQPPPTASVPATVLSTDGSSATPGSNTALRAASGQVLYFGPYTDANGNTAIYANGQYTTGLATVMGLLNGGQLYVQNAQGTWYQWNGSSYTTLSSAPQQAPPTGTQTAPSTTVPIPAGYTLYGNDATSGLPVYQGLSGSLYSWTGTAMTPYTGTLNTASGQIQVTSGVPQSVAPIPSMSVGSQQSYNSLNPPAAPAIPPSYTVDPNSGQLIPLPGTSPSASGAPITAGVSTSGLPSWLTWGAVAAGLYLMLATAHPKGMTMPKRAE